MTKTDASPAALKALRLGITEHFSADEITEIGADLSLDLARMDGEGARARATALVDGARRAGRLPALLAYVAHERPNQAWPRLDAAGPAAAPASAQTSDSAPELTPGAGRAALITDAWVRRFLASLHDASDNTRSAYRAGLTLAAQAKLTLDETVLEQFNAFLVKRRFAKATKQLYLAALRRFLQWLDANDQLPPGFNRAKAEAKLRVTRGNAREGYRHRAADPDLPRIITYYDEQPLPGLDEKHGAIRRLELLRARAVIHTLYASAGRVSEVASLTRAQVADGRASETVITGKGNKERMLFLTPEAQRAIRAYCSERDDPYPALFISHRKAKGQALTRMSIWRAVKHAVHALGLSKITSPHSFRHYRATQLLNEGMPLESVQAYLGHASPETTRIVYAHTKTAVLRDQLSTFGLSPKEATRGGH